MTQGLKFDPYSPEAQFNLARFWYLKGKYEVAIAGYQKAIELQPDYTEAYLKLADLFLQEGRQEDAIAVYHEAIELNPNDAIFYNTIIEQLLKKAPSLTSPQKINPGKGHILLYTDSPGIYGVPQWNHTIASQLFVSGYRVTFAQSKAWHHLTKERIKLGIKHLWLEDDNIYHPTKPGNALSNTSEAQNIFQEAKPDLIIFADGCPVSSLAAKQVAIQMGIPYIQVIHCVSSDWAKQFALYLNKLPDIYCHATEVITVSHENLELLHDHFYLPEHQGKVIYNGRPSQYFNPPNSQIGNAIRQELTIPPDAIVCLTTARLDLVKGYQYQLSAIAQLQNRDIWSKLYFIWAGSGTLLLRLENLATEMGVSKQIKFIGERSDIPDLLDAADIFILPSQFEGMPLAIMEAMAKGKPVIASAVSGIPEELGDTGKLLPDPKIDPQATIRELADTIQTWAEDRELRHTVGQGCKNRAKKLFQEGRMIEEYRDIIERTLSNRSDYFE